MNKVNASRYRVGAVTVLKCWLPLFIIITFLSGMVYVVAQQGIRLGADDQPAQASQYMAAQVSQGHTLNFDGDPTIDIATDLATYTMIFDGNGKLVTGDARLDGKPPVIPAGVFEYAKSHADDRVTWQPAAGVRQAIVVRHYTSNDGEGYVVSGRNLKEIERLENTMLELVAAGWAVTSLVSLATVILLTRSTAA